MAAGAGASVQADARHKTEAHARHALTLGQAAWLTNDREAALRWLDRAHRLVPADPNVMLVLATVCLEHDPPRAAELFQAVALRHDVRQAWAGLATALLHQAKPQAAVPALTALLSRHVFAEDAARLAARIAPQPGWCGLHPDGRLEVGCEQPVRISLDGVALANPKLPPGWRRHRLLEVKTARAHLLGSPIRLDAIGRLSGCVGPSDGGISGWAWHPADPDRNPELILRWPASRLERRLTLQDESQTVPHTGPLARPRSFHIPAHELPSDAGPLHVLGPDGKLLPGSPLDPCWDSAGFAALASRIARTYPVAADAREDGGASAARSPSATPHFQSASNCSSPLLVSRSTRRGNAGISSQALSAPAEQAGGALAVCASVPRAPVGAGNQRRGIAIVIPVHEGPDATRACLASVLDTAPPEAVVIVVDDGSAEPDLVSLLDALAGQGRIRLIRHRAAQGFPAAANAGMRAARGRDVILLNSDTLVPSEWVQRLQAAAHSAADIGTVTPFSNEASILSYPGPAGSNTVPSLAEVRRLDRVAQRANGAALADIPVGVGFCLYIRRDCLNATGLFRADLFAQGYGEENDFCLRARRLGWRSVALPGLFVGHAGGLSFGGTAVHLRMRNDRILETLHPGHDALIQDFIGRDPLAPFRRRLDLARWKQAARGRPSVVLISHGDGGGVEQRLIQSAVRHRDEGRRPIILRPRGTSRGGRAIAVHDGTEDDFDSLAFEMPSELPALLALLRAARPQAVEVHHLLNHAPAVYDLISSLGVPFDVHIHDYLWVCPRVALVPRDHYCGEPELHECEACMADNGHFMSEGISVADLRARSAWLLRQARTVIAPSADAARRLKRYVPDLSPMVVPHGDDGALPPLLPPRRSARSVRVCVVGGIGVHKGYDIILACARDAAHRGLDLEFVIVGTSIDDDRLLATGRVFITGPYTPGEAVDLIRRQDADLGFIASIWPETWCLTLDEMWRAGLAVAAFDLGAPSERISAVKRGFLLPLGLPPGAINNAVIGAACSAGSGTAGVGIISSTGHVALSHPSDLVVQAGR